MKATVCQIMDGIKAREKDYATMNTYSGNSGPYSRCVKCGGLEASTALKKKSMLGFIEGGNSWELFTDTAYEVIERRCPKCGHTWEEKPLDASRNEAADIARTQNAIHTPASPSPCVENADQAIAIMDSLCASPALPPALYGWQKEAWAYIRSCIVRGKCSVEPLAYKRTDLLNKWSGYREGFEVEQKVQPQVYPSGYVRNLLESFVSDLKSGMEKFEEIQKITV